MTENTNSKDDGSFVQCNHHEGSAPLARLRINISKQYLTITN